jgi:hypothetical protein
LEEETPDYPHITDKLINCTKTPISPCALFGNKILMPAKNKYKNIAIKAMSNNFLFLNFVLFKKGVRWA